MMLLIAIAAWSSSSCMIVLLIFSSCSESRQPTARGVHLRPGRVQLAQLLDRGLWVAAGHPGAEARQSTGQDLRGARRIRLLRHLQHRDSVGRILSATHTTEFEKKVFCFSICFCSLLSSSNRVKMISPMVKRVGDGEKYCFSFWWVCKLINMLSMDCIMKLLVIIV